MGFGSVTQVTLVCTANVCRSVYAAGLLTHALGQLPVSISSAGQAVHGRLAACSLVTARLGAKGIAPPNGTGRAVTREDLVDSSLVLAMTTDHRAALGRLAPETKPRTFTLMEAAELAEALRERTDARLSLSDWVAAMTSLRGRVPMPVDVVSPGRRRLFGPRTPKQFAPRINIADGHVSARSTDHDATLNLVEAQCAKLSDALLATVAEPGRS